MSISKHPPHLKTWCGRRFSRRQPNHGTGLYRFTWYLQQVTDLIWPDLTPNSEQRSVVKLPQYKKRKKRKPFILALVEIAQYGRLYVSEQQIIFFGGSDRGSGHLPIPYLGSIFFLFRLKKLIIFHSVWIHLKQLFLNKLPVPAWDSKWGRDEGGKKCKWCRLSSSRQAGSNNSYLLPLLIQFKCSYGSEVLHLNLLVQYMQHFYA